MMRRTTRTVPRGDALCLFCASRSIPSSALSAWQAPRRSIHSRNRLNQSAQTVAQSPLRSQDSQGQVKAQKDDSGGWGKSSDSGGWGSKASTPTWSTNQTRILGEVKPSSGQQVPIRMDRSSNNFTERDTHGRQDDRLRQAQGGLRIRRLDSFGRNASEQPTLGRSRSESGPAVREPQESRRWGHRSLDLATPPSPGTPHPGTPRAPQPDSTSGPTQRGRAAGWGSAESSNGTSEPGERSSTVVPRVRSKWDAAPLQEKEAESTSNFRGIRKVMPPATDQGSTQNSPEMDEIETSWVSETKNTGNAVQHGSQFRRRGRFDLAGEAEQSSTASRQKSKRSSRRGRNDEDDSISAGALDRMERRVHRKAAKAQKRVDAPTPIILPDFISIGNLAAAMRMRPEDLNEKLQDLGFEDFTNDHVIGAEDAGLIAQEFNFEPTVAPPVKEQKEDLVAAPEPSLEDKDLMLNRPPVITIMGHVDHGKTTLLDFLRKSSIAAGEHGGITQHIGAFTVEMSSGRTITFLDTPGHSAFLEMRQRGANVTDIVILVVAADDSVKPQTLEAIKHAQGAGVPMIVAISKADKDEANPDRVKRDLAQHGIEVEDFGGDVQAIPVSGKTGQGMEDLEDAAIALADVLDVRADTAGSVEGWVLESKLKPQGRVATLLMKRGTLRPGAILVAGTTWTRVRTLRNEAGQVVAEATPGQPVEVDGWDDTPEAGAEALEAPNMQRARDVCELREERAESEKLASVVAATNERRVGRRAQRAITKEQEEMSKRSEKNQARADELEAAAELAKSNATSKFIEAPVIVRADVAGSAEAVSSAILAMGNTEIRVRILREEVGAIAASDVELAENAEGVIINFGQPIPGDMRRILEKKSVKVIDGNVIYRITEAVKEYLEDKLPTLRTTRVLGEADILQVFNYKVKGKGVVPVAGCRISNGTVEKGKNAKIVRAGQVVYDGKLISLKNHKRDVDTMQKGTDCGMGFEDFTTFEVGDKLQIYEVHEERRKL